MEWIDTTVGEYCPFVYGKGLPQAKRKQGTIKVYGSNGPVDTHSEACVSTSGIIIGRKGSVGAVHLSKEPFWPIDTAFYIVNENYDELRFTYYLLKSLGLENMNSDSAVPGLNRDNAHALPIRIPESSLDREALGKWIATLDNKVAMSQQINQTLEAMAQGLFKSWFADFEPTRAKIAALEAGGSEEDATQAAMTAISGKSADDLTAWKSTNPETYAQLHTTASLFPSRLVESELGEIPEGWEASEIGKEVTVVGGGTPSTKKPEFWDDGDIPWTTPRDISNLHDKILIDTDRKITKQGLAKISSGLLPVNTVLMSSRAPVGYLALAKVPVAVNQGYIAMKCEKNLTPEYVLQWCAANMDDIKLRASGTTFAEISKSTFRPMTVLVPEAEVLQAYSRQVAAIYSQIETLVRESHALAFIRDSLLPKLLSGEITIQENHGGE